MGSEHPGVALVLIPGDERSLVVNADQARELVRRGVAEKVLNGVDDERFDAGVFVAASRDAALIAMRYDAAAAVCDFCSDRPVVRLFGCETFAQDGHRSLGDWSACAVCADLVDRADIEGLADRAVAHAGVPKAIARDARVHLKGVFRAFFANRNHDDREEGT